MVWLFTVRAGRKIHFSLFSHPSQPKTTTTTTKTSVLRDSSPSQEGSPRRLPIGLLAIAWSIESSDDQCPAQNDRYDTTSSDRSSSSTRPKPVGPNPKRSPLEAPLLRPKYSSVPIKRRALCYQLTLPNRKMWITLRNDIARHQRSQRATRKPPTTCHMACATSSCDRLSVVEPAQSCFRLCIPPPATACCWPPVCARPARKWGLYFCSPL